jgi:hypothetical protein
LKPGDQVVVRYTEAIAAQFVRPDESGAPASSQMESAATGPGQPPGVMSGEQVRATVAVEAIDPAANKVTVVAPADRLAVFDNDGTLWVEQPVYTQLAFAFDSLRALAPQHPDWANRDPFRAVIAGDMAALARGSENTPMTGSRIRAGSTVAWPRLHGRDGGWPPCGAIGSGCSRAADGPRALSIVEVSLPGGGT